MVPASRKSLSTWPVMLPLSFPQKHRDSMTVGERKEMLGDYVLSKPVLAIA